MDAIAINEALMHRGWKQRSLPGFIGLVGPLWTCKEEVSWAYGLLATKEHTNPAGVVHGGLLTTLMDHALSSIAWEAMQRRACMTVQLDTQFLTGAREGQFLEARGKVIRATSSLVFMQGEIRVGEAIVITASAILKMVSAGDVERKA
ncbi:PaaI family thioesterase [Azohydromonas lata]|uniref:PaaI family thioesterase n=1 Tax=Azohydromonas lata TaxID=45677 RepID=A0ABU5IP87_9BURK|nr:PaaI family thioesterase [Azohydromonas lata]MDZ5460721.1 PaaI family thioesterase [Azohydromonas lata]